MGREATCEVRWRGRTASGVCRFEEKEIVFRGEFRLKVPLAEVRRATAAGGRLTLEFGGERAVFALGAEAEKWKARIERPRGRLDKLGVAPGARVGVLGLDDAAFLAELRERGAVVTAGRLPRAADLVFLSLTRASELPRLVRARRAIRPDGAVWVLWPKGRRELREDDVRAFGPEAGLVDVKVVSFSDTLSGLKMMVPRALR